MFLESIHLQGFLSFPPDAPPIPLKALNVLIGPNGSGKSNILEAFSVLQAAPSDLSVAFRNGGSLRDTIWDGLDEDSRASIAVAYGARDVEEKLKYYMSYSVFGLGLRVLAESVSEISSKEENFFYINVGERPVLKRHVKNKYGFQLERVGDLHPNKSILSQKKDSELYHELYILAERFENIQIFSDWHFGRRASIRRGQDASGTTSKFLNDGSNFAIFINKVQFEKEIELNDAINRFLPRFVSVKTLVSDGFASLYFVERGVSRPISASRLSDGTLRFLAIVATLLHPEPPSLLCIEEPELGMHPDAAALLAELLVEASQRMQIIVTTHSEAFLSALTRHDVNVLVTENFGQGTEVTQFDQEELASWLDKYTLGDLWRIGKIGGNP